MTQSGDYTSIGSDLCRVNFEVNTLNPYSYLATWPFHIHSPERRQNRQKDIPNRGGVVWECPKVIINVTSIECQR